MYTVQMGRGTPRHYDTKRDAIQAACALAGLPPTSNPDHMEGSKLSLRRLGGSYAIDGPNGRATITRRRTP